MGYLRQQQPAAGGVGEDRQGLVDGVAAQQGRDGSAVFGHDGLVEPGLEHLAGAPFRGVGPISDQLPAASPDYVSHEKRLRVRTQRSGGLAPELVSSRVLVIPSGQF